MPDWKRYVREHLPPLALGAERELEIVQELTEHLDAVYEDALARGASEQEAYERAVTQIKDWGLLECEVVGAEHSGASALVNRTIGKWNLSEKSKKGGIGMGSFKDGAGNSGGSRSTLGKSLVVLQVALSLVLLVGAGLFLRTLRNLQNVDVGFNTENVLLFRADPRVSGHKSEQIADVYQQMAERISAIPGVRQASFSKHMPLSGGYATSTITVLGRASGCDRCDDRLGCSAGERSPCFEHALRTDAV